jgi:excisionase family DNA binding protein
MAAVAILTDEQIRAMLREAAELGARRALDLASPAALTTAQAAALTGRKQKTVQEWIASGRLPARKRGRLLTILRSDLERFLAGEKVGNGRADEDLDRSLRREG